MPRRMSCSMTVDAVRDRTKTVTRRHPDTWTTLAPGDRLTLIEKGMGLPKGACQVVLAEVEVIDVRLEPLALLLTDAPGRGRPDCASPRTWRTSVDDTAWIPPGSDDAIDAGCRCPVLDNAHGRGYLGLGHTAGWVISSGCPMHWTEDHRHAAPRTIGGDRG